MKQPILSTLKAIVNSQQQNASQPETTQNTDSQAADWLWEKMAEIYGEQWIRERGEFPSLIWKAALNKQTEADVKHAVAEVINQAITWPPNLPEFMKLCQGPQIDTDDAFNRMVSRKPCNGIAEFETRQECSYRCRRLSEDKSRALFKKHLIINIQKVRNGELIERDFNPVQISSPEVFRDTESEEMRNSRLDAEIGVKLAKGERLIGHWKKRHLETNGE